MIENAETPLAIGEEKPLDARAMARNAFEASKSYFDSAVRAQVDADLRQFYGIHPSGSKYHSEAFKGRSKIFRPKTRMAIRKNEAIAAEALFSTTDVVSISPTDPDDPVQSASAAINKELLQYRLTKTIPWFVTAIGAYQDAQSVGICASYQYWKYDKARGLDEPCCDLIPVENLRFDPTADWRDVVKSSPYFIHMMPMYVKDVKARMKRDESKTGLKKWTHADDNVIKQAIVGYSDSTRQLREDKRPDSASADRGISDFTVVWVYRVFMEVDGKDMVWYCLANTYHPLTEPVPVAEMYWHGKRPYQVGFCVIETHKTHPSGLSRLTKEQQAEINEIANSRIDNVKLAMSKRWKAKRGKQVDVKSLTRSIPNSVTLLTDMDDVEPIEFNDVTASSYQEQDRLNLDFDDMAGSFSQSSVQSNRNLNETVGGMNQIVSGTNQVSGYQLRVWIETWVEPVLRQLILLEQYYEDDQVILALAGKKAQAFQKFGVDAITDELLMQELTVNVNVGMSATNPQQQVERFAFGLRTIHEVIADGTLQAAGADVGEISKEIWGKLGYRDGERFFPPKEEGDPKLAELEQTVAALQAELAAKRPPPELTAAQVEKMKAETDEIKVRTASAGMEEDIQGEIEAQMAELQKRHDEEKRALSEKLASRDRDIAAKSETAKYAADKKAETDIERARVQAAAAEKIAAAKPRPAA